MQWLGSRHCCVQFPTIWGTQRAARSDLICLPGFHERIALEPRLTFRTHGVGSVLFESGFLLFLQLPTKPARGVTALSTSSSETAMADGSLLDSNSHEILAQVKVRTCCGRPTNAGHYRKLSKSAA